MYVSEHVSDYSDVRGVFDCPIVPAFWHREVERAAEVLKPILSAALGAETLLRIAQSSAALGKSSEARVQFADASNVYTKVITAYTEQNPTGLLYGFCQTRELNKIRYGKRVVSKNSAVSGWLRIVESKVPENDPCDGVKPDGEYAWLLEAYSKAAFGQSKLVKFANGAILDDALRAAAASVTSSVSYATWFGHEPKAGDANDRGPVALITDDDFSRRLVLLGDVLFEKGAYERSADAYSTASKVRFAEPDVAKKWGTAIGMAAKGNPRAAQCGTGELMPLQHLLPQT
jgi:hypothetical protein